MLLHLLGWSVIKAVRGKGSSWSKIKDLFQEWLDTLPKHCLCGSKSLQIHAKIYYQHPLIPCAGLQGAVVSWKVMKQLTRDVYHLLTLKNNGGLMIPSVGMFSPRDHAHVSVSERLSQIILSLSVNDGWPLQHLCHSPNKPLFLSCLLNCCTKYLFYSVN